MNKSYLRESRPQHRHQEPHVDEAEEVLPDPRVGDGDHGVAKVQRLHEGLHVREVGVGGEVGVGNAVPGDVAIEGEGQAAGKEGVQAGQASGQDLSM